MMPDSSLLDFFAGIHLFDELNEIELKKIVEVSRKKVFKKGDNVFLENTPREALGILFKGRIELYKKSSFGKEKRLAMFGPGDFLGEGSLMDDYPHSTSARAVNETTFYLIYREDFKKLFEEFPTLVSKVLSSVARIISRRMRQTSTRVVDAGAQYVSGKTRLEHDLLGDRQVPDEFYYGVQTLRALENFNITGISLTHYSDIIVGLAQVKQGAARANHDLGLLEDEVAFAIDSACQEIIDGRFHTHFVVDMIQGGAGTSTNMNANEVIANRALELIDHEKGEYQYCHPNSHVNLAQSTNDAYPTAMKIALVASNKKLIKVLAELVESFRSKGREFAHVIKMGRTQLQDAVPMTLGQAFDAYGETLSEEIARLEENAKLFHEMNMGGTAIGTGINADPDYPEKVTEHLQKITGIDLKLAGNLVEATQDTGSFVMYSSALKRLAVKLSKICNDLRLIASGPRAGFNEINLPEMQPGSSIMPGKVNPVIPEVVNQVAFKVIGNDLTVTMAAEAGQLELNVMEPVIVQSLFESIDMLKNGMVTLKYRCIDGITANEEVCRKSVENSIGIVTALNPALGYEICTKLAKTALDTGKSVYELVIEQKLLAKAE
jgi:aspartate ammonia-lyase